MDNYELYNILFKNRERDKNKKICEIVSDLLDELIPATYGYFFLQEIFLNCHKILSYLKDYEKILGENKCKKLKLLCENEIGYIRKQLIDKEFNQNKNKEMDYQVSAIIAGMQIEENLGLKTKDLGNLFVNPHPDCLEYCLAHVFLFTKNLLDLRGGRMVDPTTNDGLYLDLKNAKKFYKIVMELRSWETDRLWDSVWEPFGGQPHVEQLDVIPDEEIPFEIEEIRWEWGWKNKDEFVSGYLIDIRDLVVHPNETLVKVESRIDKAIQPIKKYLSRKKPFIHDINLLFPDIDIIYLTIMPLRGKYRRTI